MTHESQLRTDPVVGLIILLTLGASYFFFKPESERRLG